MVQIEGEYVYSKGEGVIEFFSAFSQDAEAIKKFANSKPGTNIKHIGGDEWTIAVVNEGHNSSSTFKLGVPYDENMPTVGTLKSVTTRNGNNFITVTEAPGGQKFTRAYEFTPSGIVVELSSEATPLKCKRFYNRV